MRREVSSSSDWPRVRRLPCLRRKLEGLPPPNTLGGATLGGRGADGCDGGCALSCEEGEPAGTPVDCRELGPLLRTSLREPTATPQPTIGTERIERVALMQLYAATRGPQWTHSENWNTSAPICEWWGVICDDGGAVTKLDLASNNLKGTLPAALANLTLMRDLCVSARAPASVAVLDLSASRALHAATCTTTPSRARSLPSMRRGHRFTTCA